MQNQFDVIIVGAGLAGLRAARELHKCAPHLKLLVLEAKDRVGGRTLTIPMSAANGTEDQWDLGGQWVGTTQTHVLELMRELGIEMYPQYIEGNKLGQLGGTKIRPYSDTLPINASLKHYSFKEGIDFVRTMIRFEKKVAEIDILNPFSHPEANELDTYSLQDYANLNCSTRTMIDSLDVATRVAMGATPDRLSTLYMLMYSKAAGKYADLLEATPATSANGYRIKGGSQQLSRMMADDLPKDTVKLQHAVFRINWGTSGVTVECHDNRANDKAQITQFMCTRLIMAIPPNQSARIEYSPPLPDIKHQLFQSAPCGNLIKFVATYSRSFWRENGFSGEIVSSGLFNATEPHPVNLLFLINFVQQLRNPVSVTFDATTAFGNPALVGFIHNEWADIEKVERKAAVLSDLCRFYGAAATEVVDYEDKVWSMEPYSGGCPVAVIPPGATYLYARIRDITGNIHWCGTETATLWPGYMSGAVQSGLRAAHEVLHYFQPPSVNLQYLHGSVLHPDYRVPQPPNYFYTVSKYANLYKGIKLIFILSACSAIGFFVFKRVSR